MKEPTDINEVRRRRKERRGDGACIQLRFQPEGGVDFIVKGPNGQEGDVFGCDIAQAQDIAWKIIRHARMVQRAEHEATHVTMPKPIRQWRRCTITPNGHTSSGRLHGCNRHRGHEGMHKNETSVYEAICRHEQTCMVRHATGSERRCFYCMALLDGPKAP